MPYRTANLRIQHLEQEMRILRESLSELTSILIEIIAEIEGDSRSIGGLSSYYPALHEIIERLKMTDKT